ncbi:MAG: DNA internalization-related competence protein ComEC/Rec2 [Oscillospiraceae bacterium]|jgi:competence protein ComEC|nr:DNA internalization-related competence protein ComEC/Rec2 [Oscillospiraceae bacterium]
MRRLARAALAFSAAIFAAHYMVPERWTLPCAVFFAAASVFGFAFRSEYRRLTVYLVCVGAAAGFTWYACYTAIFVSPAAAFVGSGARVTAYVADYPQQLGRGSRVTVSVRLRGRPDVKSYLYMYGEQPDVAPGDLVEFEAEFSSAGEIRGEATDVFTSKGYFLSATLSGGLKVLGSSRSPVYAPQKLSKFVRDMSDAVFPPELAPFMRALIMGDTAQLREDTALSAALSAAGISHIVAVSGMHISFLIGFLGLVIKNKRALAIFGIPTLFIFMAMIGFTPSVTRAGVMQCVLLLAPLLRRESDSITTLSAALMLLLIVNPYSCANVGLQLSFGAAAGIILFTGRIDESIENALRDKKIYARRIPRAAVKFVTASLATTAGALVFTTPLSAVYFGYISLVAPLTNLLTLWAVSVCFCGGMAACLLGFAFLPAGGVIAAVISLTVRYVFGITYSLARFPFATVYVSNIYVSFWLVYMYIAAIAFLMARGRLRQTVIPICLSVLTLCGALFVTYSYRGAPGFTTTALDIGQGQSLVFTSGEYTAVVDCGSSSGENAGGLAHEFLSAQGRPRIDMLILTHFHADHCNGVEDLMTRIDVETLIIPEPDGGDDESYLAEDIIELARRRGTVILYITRQQTYTFGDAAVTLYPPFGGDDENERGLAILFSDGDYDVLITGDMDSENERRLIRNYDIPDIETLIVGHHGSRYSTSVEFLNAVTPETAVISVGRNSYGHPTSDTLGRLAERGISVYRTDIIGNVTISGG